MKDFFPFFHRTWCASALALCLFAGRTFAQSAVTVTVDLKNPGQAIAPDYLGLSFETEKILADGHGRHYFSPTNKALVATFRTLGIKNLRIGGNTSDRATVKIPNETDVDNLFQFAKAADAKVIYTFRLKEGDAAAAAQMAKYIHDHYRSDLVCFAIGNEPSAFGKEYTYAIYRGQWQKIMDAVVAAVPGAKFCGANVHEKPEWARQFAADFGPSGRVATITEHFYPGGSAYNRPEAGMTANDDVRARTLKNPAMGRDQMLSAEWLGKYQKLYEGFGPTVKSNGLPYRLEEANNFFHGGLQGASDSFASALWGLDFLHWWAAHDCDGINFHTGDVVAAGGQNTACRYATFLTAPDGYEVHPIGYAIKAFDFGSRGKRVPVAVSSSNNANVTAYAVLGADGNLYLTLINKEHGTNAQSIAVDLNSGGQRYSLSSPTEVMLLAEAKGDLAATKGITLGDAEIKNDASWKGAWKEVPRLSMGRKGPLTIPASSAAIIKVRPATND